ncbi:MAG: hypothetical protein JHD16_00250 [Solirubrobacteraceae bacterium]|nr:hypothetical protein [Solirubrobacteraceae bacterium]
MAAAVVRQAKEISGGGDQPCLQEAERLVVVAVHVGAGENDLFGGASEPSLRRG